MRYTALVSSWKRWMGLASQRATRHVRKARTLYFSQQLETRVLLTTMTLSGTGGADVIVFQQTDATHDTFTLNGVANTFSTAGVTAIVINSGAGSDQITIQSVGAGIPITVTGSGSDTVTLGNSGDMRGILSDVTLSGSAGQMSLIADDSSDPDTRTVTISSTEIDGLAPAAIKYTAGQLASIVVKGGHGNGFIGTGGNGAGNLFTVTSTSGSTSLSIDGGQKTPGQAGSFTTLTAPNVDQTWNLTGVYSGSVGQVSFTNMVNLTGGTANDRFVFAKNSLFNIVEGGGGNDAAVSPTGVGDSWSIFDTNFAVTNEASLHNIQNLIGGNTTTGFDTFSFVGGTVTGVIDGGGGHAQIRAGNSSNNFTVTGTNSGTYNGAMFQNMPSLFVGSGFNSQFNYGIFGNVVSIEAHGPSAVVVGPDQANAWEITGANAGRLNSSGAINNLSGITKFVGGSGVDTFTLDNFSAAVGTFDGGGGSDKLVAPNAVNTWTVTGANAGTLDGASFSNIENLTGGNTTDTFSIGDNGSVAGSIDGGAGPGTLDYSTRTLPVVVNLQTNSGTGVGGALTGVQAVIGTPADDRIIGSNAGSVITGNGGNDTLYGGTGDDTFILTSNQGGGTYINGISGNDTLIAANVVNNWAIYGTNMGAMTGASFGNIRNLVGGSANDTFTFGGAGVISGNIDAGAGTNTLDYSSRSIGIVANLPANTATAIGGTVTHIDNVTGSTGNDQLIAVSSGSVLKGAGGNDKLIGGAGNDTFILASTQGISTTVSGGGGNDTLVSPNTTSTWNITGVNSGTLNGASYNNIRNLTGGTGDDIFAFGPAGVVTGNVDGGGGADVLDYSARTTGIVVMLQDGLATSIGGAFSNISSIKGSAGADTLTGGNGTNTWGITGTNSGTINNSFSFSGFENLTGGAAIDIFSFTGSGNVTGLIRGGGGGGIAYDTLDYSSLSTGVVVDLSIGVASRTGGVSAIRNVRGSTGNDFITAGNSGGIIDGTAGNDNLTGGAGDDRFVMGPTQDSGTVIDGRGGNNTLLAPDVANTWNILNVNEGSLNGAPFRNIQNLTGSLVSDRFQFGSSGVLSGNLSGGGGGAATLDYSGRTVGVVVDLSANTATAIGGKISGIGTVEGSSGADVLVGANTPNIWNVNGIDTGNVNNSFSFYSFESLIGGTDVDQFVMNNGGSVSGTINGRLGARNWIDYGSYSSAVAVDLNLGTATNTGGISNIQNVRGGNGGNTLTGNSAGNVLIGGAGIDTIVGGSGRSVLIGGDGVDAVTGGSADDIVIGGYTTLDNPALGLILAEWQSANDYATRIAHLTGTQPGGLNLNLLTPGDSVHDDFVIDTLTGGSGMDWFFKGTNDVMTDHQAGEQIS